MEAAFGLLHIGKTGMTAFQDVLLRQAARSGETRVQCFSHDMNFLRFCQDHPSLKCIFFIREPLSRFVSGFYSRQRQGQPRYHSPWKPEEERAFARFSTPNSLAEALFSKDMDASQAGRRAMQAIGHVKDGYESFLISIDTLETYIDRIAFIGQQESLSGDLERLRPALGIDHDLLLPADEKTAHRNPPGLDRHLSAEAMENLKRWYARDIDIYQWCLNWRKRFVG